MYVLLSQAEGSSTASAMKLQKQEQPRMKLYCRREFDIDCLVQYAAIISLTT